MRRALVRLGILADPDRPGPRVGSRRWWLTERLPLLALMLLVFVLLHWLR